MEMERAQRISDIISKRKPFVSKIEAVKGNLNSLGTAFVALERQRDKLLDLLGGDDKDTVENLRKIEVNSLPREIVEQTSSLDRLKKRFSRKTLNIAVIGRARQGKSRLLQSLSGLSPTEIPDGSSGHCTGVRSTIFHDDRASETSAEVVFHTERSFLEEVIYPYYEELELGRKPTFVDDFSRDPLPPLSDGSSTADEAKYDHLQRYKTHLDSYGGLLNESPRSIPGEEIRTYVAQDGGNYRYMAVREVKITCHFPKEDVGQIALVDLPGLGDTRIGDAERLIKTLSQDVDFVLFVRKPDPLGDSIADVDISLYDTARSALREIPLEEWSFMVFNTIDPSQGDNSKLCRELSEKVDEGSTIKVAETIIANCADPQSVSTGILDPLLNYLDGNIKDLDERYLSACLKNHERLHHAIDMELERARTALGKPESEDDRFDTLFEDDLWGNLTLGLTKLLEGFREDREKVGSPPRKQFEEAVATIIKDCRTDTNIPTLNDIETRLAEKDSFAPAAQAQYMSEIRAHLSQKFLKLDKGLEGSFNGMKTQVSKILIEKGRLGGLTGVSSKVLIDEGGPPDSRGKDFLEAIKNLLPDETHTLSGKKESAVKEGFKILSDFTLSYRGFVQHRIRKCLDDLTHDTSNKSESPSSPPETDPSPEENSSTASFSLWDILSKIRRRKEPSPAEQEGLSPEQVDALNDIFGPPEQKKLSPAEQIQEELKSLHAEAVSKCETALKDLFVEPSEAVFAIVEEFNDRVLRAEGVEREWRRFLRRERYRIWPEKFGLLGEGTKLREEWDSIIERIEKANKEAPLSATPGPRTLSP